MHPEVRISLYVSKVWGPVSGSHLCAPGVEVFLDSGLVVF